MAKLKIKKWKKSLFYEEKRLVGLTPVLFKYVGHLCTIPRPKVDREHTITIKRHGKKDLVLNFAYKYFCFVV